ncbi:MAG: TldD/PmbA family protein [Methanomassiliicoccales archaeon]|nr:MAG: TldD/PmbA family protein [Methanomassiliicoccales archaeon]
MSSMIDSAKRIVEMALKKGAEEAEVFIMKSDGRGFTIEKNSVSSIAGGIEKGIGIRIIKDKKLGFAYCTEEKKADSALEQAISLSKLGNESEFTLPEPDKIKKIENLYDDRIVSYDDEDALEGTTTMINSALEVDSEIVITRGGVGYGSESFAVVNSKGLEMEDAGTEIYASVSAVLKKNGMSTGFEKFSSRTLDIDYHAIGRECANLALKGQNARKIEDKEMTVIFTPYALANLLEFITAPAMYGEAVHKGESVYTGRIGEQVASEDITIIDDGMLAGGLNSALVDDEGVPSKRTELIKKGILQGFLYSQSSAIEFNEQNTGNAMRAERFGSSRNYKSPPGVKARNIVIEGKTVKAENLIKEVDEGVLVYEILGAHTSNPASGDFSVTSPILFKIEKGEFAYPIKSAMLSGNFHECLKKVEGVGDDHKLVSGGLTPISFYIPSLSLGKVRVTG